VTLASLLAGYAADVPQDGKSVTPQKIENTRDARYTEIFLIGGERGDLKAAVYNTLGLNDSPPDVVKAINPEALKKEFHVLGAFVNGPRFFTMDKIWVNVGKTRAFGGLEARWIAELTLPKGANLKKKGSSAYRETTIRRTTKYLFMKGKPVFELVSPDGHTWVMQAYAHIVDPSLTFESLSTLGNRLKLADGWQYRVRTLDEDLNLVPVNGVAHIVQDDLESTYQRLD
jgi:hypothetical protein